MKGSEKQINKSQLFCLVLILGLASTVLTLPSVLAAEAGRDLWLSAVLGFAVYFAVFFLMVQIYKLNPGADLYTVIKGTLGTAGAKIVYALFAVYFGYKALMLFSETEEFCANRLYGSLPWYIYSLIIAALIVFMSVKGLKSVARSGQLSLFFIIAALAVCLGSAAGRMDFARLLPIAEKGFAPVFKGFYKTAAWFGDSLVIFMMMGKIKSDKKLPGSLYAAYGITGLAAVFFMAAYYALYGSLSGFQGHGEAFANIINFSKESSMGLMGSIFNQMWLLACLVKLAVLFWACSEAVMKVTGCENPLFTALPLAAALYILDVFVIDNIDAALYAAATYGSWAAAGIYVALPAAAHVCAVIYKKSAGARL